MSLRVVVVEDETLTRIDLIEDVYKRQIHMTGDLRHLLYSELLNNGL